MVEETPNLTLEDKKANYEYILNKLDKYIVDSLGNFYSLELEMERNPKYYVAKNALSPSDYKKLRKKINPQ